MSTPRTLIAALGVSAAALVGIAQWEGYRGAAYDDGVGVQTIGFGSTAGVRPGERTDPVRALVRLSADADRIAGEIADCIGDVPLHQHEWDAYVGLAYNIGSGPFCKSTLLARLHSRPPVYAAACREILRWNKAGGRVLPGLTKRREAEYRRCMGETRAAASVATADR